MVEARTWFQIVPGRFRLDIRKNLFMETVVGRWNGLPRGLVEPPSLEAFSRRGIKGHDLVMGLGEPG